MNKYLKFLMLSGGLVGSIALTAFDTPKTQNNDLSSVYADIEKMKQALPNLSRINYKLNIDLDTIGETSEQTISEQNIEDNSLDKTLEENIDNDEINNSSEGNISFTTTDEIGNQTLLDNHETLYYLHQTLNQTNTEYENLKTTLNNAIKDTMDYLDAYKNGETSLSNEQKVYIKEQANCIKFLAETLEDLSEDVICCIDGCENCNDDFEKTAGQYLSLINNLETRINALNSAISSLQFINNISNPFFFRANPNHIIYGYHYNSNEQESDQYIYNNLDENNDNQNINNTENNNITNQDNNLTEDLNDENKDETIVEVENDNVDDTSNEDKPTTFGLKSNIDTYAPTKRNIDTFFNTALYNNEYNRYGGYGYGMPYGGYGMPYGGGFGNPYGANYLNPYNQELNSNLINRNELDKQNESPSITNTSATIETKNEDKNKTSKSFKTKRIKPNKNIDTFTQTTVNSNVNTMGESKISNFFKQKFNGLRDKIRRQKDDANLPKQLPNTAEKIDDLENNNSSKYTTNSVDNDYSITDLDTCIDANKTGLDKDLIDIPNNNSPINPKQTKDIFAK